MTTEEPKQKEPTISDFMRRVFNSKYQSIWVACLGKNQSGKTDFMLYTMQRLHDLGLGDGFGSNIANLDTSELETPFEIDFIEDYQTLKKRCQMLNPNPKNRGIKRYFYLGDEMGDWAPKDMPWLNVKFIKEMQQVRKYGLCFLACAIDRVDERILNEKHFHGYFVKSKANPKSAFYYDWMRGDRTRFVNIPRTKIEFDTFYSASFFMEPQVPAEFRVPLNQEHEMIQTYRQNGHSWDKTEYSRTQGKRAIDKVIDFHFATCLNSIQEPSLDNEVTEPSESS